MPSEISAEESPEWLPDGWIVEVRTRKGGFSAGAKDKYYIDPTMQCKFRSKDEVLRYLAKGKPGKLMSQPMSVPTISVPTMSVPMEGSPKWLPMGWTVEIKTRKKGRRLGSRYKCYIDPIDGYKFYSKQDIFRYLETGKRGRQTPRRKKKSIRLLSTDNNCTMGSSLTCLPPWWNVETKFEKRFSMDGFQIVTPPSGAERQKLANTTVRRCLLGSYSLISDGRMSQQISGMLWEERPLQLTNHGWDGSGPSWCAPRDADDLMQAMRGAQATQQEKQPFKLDEKKQSEFKDSKPLESRPLLEHEHKVLWEQQSMESADQNSSQIMLWEKQSMEPDNKNSLQNAALLESEDRSMLEFGVEKFKTERAPPLQSRKHRAEKQTILPCRASRRLAGLKADPAPEPTVPDQSCRPLSKWPTLPEVDTAPCATEGMEVPKAKFKPEEPESLLTFPSEDLWQDPCLEFAFKMLTGAIPVADDNLAIQDYFQQQLRVAQSRIPAGLQTPS
ncbi:uncharacterized protein LOC131231048 isoform X2 [Magnolia sinica]|uniref:uncharacterized protein LOC131231048 isoform X2 n=1 Tax=Magnolia sinica TaxID=86752 RepID=UPI002659B339|nr:uncharacterized protein LOC131231048 isoform X2 [Magnolia sinica]